MDRQEIFKNIKRKMNILQDEYNYDVLFIGLQGSQNYNLDIYTDDYQSDIDCIAVILPSFDDFVCNEPAVANTIVLGNGEHIKVRDIRLYFDLLYKQNIQFLEVLFTEYKIINKKYKLLIDSLFKKSERIANYSKLTLFNSIYGIAMEKKKAMEYPYPNIKDKIEKYGYDGKQLYQIIRLYQFILNLSDNNTFKFSFSYFDDNIKEMCIKAKLNQYTLEEARELRNKYINLIYQVKETYFLSNDVKTDDDILLFLTNLKSKILQQSFKNELLPEYKEPYKLCLDQYPNVWITSDTHFGHTNILKYETKRLEKLNVNLCNRISKYIIDNNLDVDNDEDYAKAQVEVYKQLTSEQDDMLKNNWNEVVKPNDLVLILGDFSFKKSKETEELLKQLNGDKVLIKGNHDLFLEDKSFDTSLFKAVYDYKETKYRGQEIALMHYPLQEFKHQEKEMKPAVLLFGHIHSMRKELPKHSFNVGADVNNYYPVKIEVAISKALVNNGGLINGEVQQ